MQNNSVSKDTHRRIFSSIAPQHPHQCGWGFLINHSQLWNGKKNTHSSFVRNLKLTISRNDPTLSLGEMCQHKSTRRPVRCYRWRSPVVRSMLKMTSSKKGPSPTDRTTSAISRWSFPVTGWEQLSCRALVMTSGADLTRAAVPYICQHT